MPRCSKCGSESFETVPVVLQGHSQKSHLVQCASCQTAVGVTDAPQLEELLILLRQVLVKIEGKNDFSI